MTDRTCLIEMYKSLTATACTLYAEQNFEEFGQGRLNIMVIYPRKFRKI